MKIAILGFAREGKSILKFLQNRRLTRKVVRTDADEIWILDKNEDVHIPNGYQSQLGKNYLHNLNQFDIVFRSPGVPYNLPEIQKAIKKGVVFSSLTKLFFDEIAKMVRRGSPQVIGVTGTKGKGTTSTLIYKILKAAGKDVYPHTKRALRRAGTGACSGVGVYLAGNIGKPALDILPKLSKKSLVVLELSSFQLQDLAQSPPMAVVLDIFPDHMDSHKNMAEYVTAKANVCAHQNKNDTVFYFKNNTLSRKIAHTSHGRKIAIVAPDNLSKNKFMAATVTKYLGCSQRIIDWVLKNFRGMEHRLELVRIMKTTKRYSDILQNVRISFYNDSASTNPQTSAAAVLSFVPPHNSTTVLIAGGKDKNLDYTSLARAIKKSGNVKLVVLFGENKMKIYKTLVTSNSRLRFTATDGHAQLVIKKVVDLKAAIKLAYSDAKSLITNYHLPITILFSPGAASFDMFHDYADRGRQFKDIVRRLKV